MADWVCAKNRGGWGGGSRTRRGRRKENGNMYVRKHIRVMRWRLFTESTPRLAAFVSKGQERLNSQSKKKPKNSGGNGDLQVLIRLTTSKGL